MALSNGLTETMIRSATAISSGHVNVAGFTKNKASDAWPVLHGVSALREQVQQLVPEAYQQGFTIPASRLELGVWATLAL